MTLPLYTLNRSSTSDNGTFGKLLLGEERLVVTCELPWRNNQPQASCIPKGTYRVTRFTSPSKNKQVGYQVFLVRDVPNRSMIEIHIGNTIKDVIGCIAVGLDYGNIGGQAAVMQSTPAMLKLLGLLPLEFMLEVTGVCG